MIKLGGTPFNDLATSKHSCVCIKSHYNTSRWHLILKDGLPCSLATSVTNTVIKQSF